MANVLLIGTLVGMFVFDTLVDRLVCLLIAAILVGSMIAGEARSE